MPFSPRQHASKNKFAVLLHHQTHNDDIDELNHCISRILAYQNHGQDCQAGLPIEVHRYVEHVALGILLILKFGAFVTTENFLAILIQECFLVDNKPARDYFQFLVGEVTRKQRCALDYKEAWRTNMSDLLKRITFNPNIFGGKPIIRGMRISVEMILDLLSQGATVEELLEDYPMLETDDIRACLAYAKTVIASEDIDVYATA